jgi:branched-chain amino acid transport system permease protein/neutral amino acid transport system permease protein
VILATAFTFVLTHNALHFPIILSCIAAVGAALTTSAFNESLLHAPSRRLFAPDDTLSPFIISSVVLLVYQNAALLIFGPISYVLPLPIKTFAAGEITVSLYQLVQIALLVPVTVAAAILLNESTIGKQFRALRDSSTLSQSSGLNTDRLFMSVTLVSGLLGSIAAMIIAINQDVRYTLGTTIILKTVLAAIVGGGRGPIGVAVSAIALGLFEAFATWVFPTGLSDAFLGLILVLILVVAPKGLLNLAARQQ